MTRRYIYGGRLSLAGLIFSGQLRLAAILTAASQTSNSNISANSKPNLTNFLNMNQGPRWVRLIEKSRRQKSRATVPLRGPTSGRLMNSNLVNDRPVRANLVEERSMEPNLVEDLGLGHSITPGTLKIYDTSV